MGAGHDAIRRFLEASGIEFVWEAGRGEGLWLLKAGTVAIR